MLEFGACPRCRLDINEERRRHQLIICNHCGYVATKTSQRLERQTEKRISGVMFSLFLLFVASYIQLMNWDRYALEILPLVGKETLGINSPMDSERKASICMDLKKWDCVEIEYAKQSHFENAKMLRLAQFQVKRAKYQDAAQSYYAFFKNGGNDFEASYSYAIVLSKLGQVDQAITYFDQVLAARPDVLQVTVVQNYVKLLMDHQRYNQAKILIENIRTKSGPTAGSFMEPEFQQIRHLTTASRE